MTRAKNNLFIISAIMLVLFVFHSYFIPRENFFSSFIVYSLLFAGYFLLNRQDSTKHFVSLFFIGLVFRVGLLFSLPNLSDDFYRFLWDGHLIRNGINPFLYLPSELYNNPANSLSSIKEIYDGLNSQMTYTCYPPLNQLFFLIGALFLKNGILPAIVCLKLVVLTFEVGTFFLIKGLLKQFNLKLGRVFLYWFNPLVILEISGNIHFEGVMMFFLLASFLFITRKKYVIAAVLFAFSALTKLIPLIFLPALLYPLSLKKWLIFNSIVLCIMGIAFMPFYSTDAVFHFFESLNYYFQKFEFNASIYYVVRHVGYWVKGYNIIHFAGRMLSFISLAALLFIAFYKQNRARILPMVNMLFMISVYYFLSSIIHPWYIISLLVISLFTRYRFTILWSFLIFLSYYTYRTPAFDEKLWLVFIEYAMVFSYLFFELKKNKTSLKSD